MKTIQFNANNILCGNNYPIAYYYPIAKDLVVISTGHDDSIIDDSMGYSEYIIPILEAIQSTSLKVYRLYLASITSTVTDYRMNPWPIPLWQTIHLLTRKLPSISSKINYR